MTHCGLLLTMTEPPAAMDEEFNAWYDDEHLPERLAITGFRSARRRVADVAPGDGRYLATYELDSPAVLTSRRCLGKTVVFKRWACEQQGSADPHPLARALLMAAADAPIEGLALPAAQPGWFMRLYRAYGA